MESNRIQEVFRTIGKLLYIDDIGESYATGIKAAVVALQEQTAAASGAADPYAELQSFIGPALNSTRPVVQSLERLPLIARAGVDSYLRAIAPELGQNASTTPATIANALRGQMVSNDDSVEPSGAFADYFTSNYAVALPTDDPATVPDTLITITVY